MATATVTSKGQITLPKEVREHLGLKRGDRVDFSIDPQGDVHVRAAKRHIGELFGFSKRPGAEALPLEEFNETIARSRADDDERVRSAWKKQHDARPRD